MNPIIIYRLYKYNRKCGLCVRKSLKRAIEVAGK